MRAGYREQQEDNHDVPSDLLDTDDTHLLPDLCLRCQECDHEVVSLQHKLAKTSSRDNLRLS